MPTVARNWRIAVHEAGHCVAARLLRLPRCGAASVVEPHAGAVFAADCGVASICALMAGGCAETVLFGDHDRDGNRIDRERVQERLQRLGYDDGGQALWRYTLDVLRPYRTPLVRLAIELKRARALDGDTLDALVAHYLRLHAPPRRRRGPLISSQHGI